MNVAEWIIVGILAGVLLIFLILGIVVFAKVLRLVNQMNELTDTAQEIADNASQVVSNVAKVTYTANLANLVRLLAEHYKAKKTTGVEDGKE